MCEDCWDQIHGYPSTPRTPDVVRPSFKRALSNPMSMLRSQSPVARTRPSTPTSPLSDSLVGPSLSRRIQHKASSSSLNTQSSSSSGRRMPGTRLPLPQDLERSYGELDAYPLRRSSILCKATGGGRWEPSPNVVLDGYRVPIPGGKAPFELEMERAELLERQRRSNPVVKDGAFQYRFPIKEQEPILLSTTPYNLSTF